MTQLLPFVGCVMSIFIVSHAVRGQYHSSWEILYADNLMVSAQSIDELLAKLSTWSSEMKKKGLRVNIKCLVKKNRL